MTRLFILFFIIYFAIFHYESQYLASYCRFQSLSSSRLTKISVAVLSFWKMWGYPTLSISWFIKFKNILFWIFSFKFFLECLKQKLKHKSQICWYKMTPTNNRSSKKEQNISCFEWYFEKGKNTTLTSNNFNIGYKQVHKLVKVIVNLFSYENRDLISA